MSSVFRQEGAETDRLPALSDGVIAIVITLLVLDITVPELPPNSATDVVIRSIVAEWPQFVGYVLSFWVIGIYWILHRRTFTYIERHERGIVLLNLLFLLLVAFIPYATAVFVAYPGQLGVVFLSVALALAGFSLAVLWIHASRNDLVQTGLASRAVRIQAARFLASPLVLLLAAVVALVDARLAVFTWLLLIPVNGVLQSRLVESLEESAGTA
jgi:uncharacterized membrane protein